jgi:hypothetical protein
MDQINIKNNVIDTVGDALAFNSGSVAPQVPGVVMQQIAVEDNILRASRNSIRIRDLHSTATNGPVSFQSVSVSNNELISDGLHPVTGIRVDPLASILDTNIEAALNWWGDASGPDSLGTGLGTNVDAKVVFCPWLDDVPGSGAPASNLSITCPANITAETAVDTCGAQVSVPAALFSGCNSLRRFCT